MALNPTLLTKYFPMHKRTPHFYTLLRALQRIQRTATDEDYDLYCDHLLTHIPKYLLYHNPDECLLYNLPPAFRTPPDNRHYL